MSQTKIDTRNTRKRFLSHIVSIVLMVSASIGNFAFGQTPVPLPEQNALASLVRTSDQRTAAQWVSSHFGNAGTLPFSFDYDGKPVQNFDGWTRKQTSGKLDSQRTRLQYTFTDPRTKLTVLCDAVRYSDFPAIEWTLHFTNNGGADTPIISNIQALDISLTHSGSGDYTLHYNEGSHASANDYQPHEAALSTGANQSYGGGTGMSTQSVMSNFNVVGPDTNLLIGIGWPGDWKAHFTRDTGAGLHIVSGQEVTHFLLHPGEEARSPMIALQFYTGDWLGRGQNLWRRWMMAHNMPRSGGKLPAPILETADPEINGLHYNEASEIKAQGDSRKQGLIADHWIMDAGWYPDNGNWYNVGTWEADPAQFPDGIRKVSDHGRLMGYKQILWFEPERVTAGSELDKTHPEWLIALPNNGNRLFNLGIPAARAFMTDLISQRITEFGVDLYRQDHNFDPLEYWRSQDAVDRQGITEIKNIEGFLAFWDGLVARHPGMLIDCCASGGRRNDLEVLRRAIPLLQSDYRFEPNGTQGNNYGAAFWMPYHGDGGPEHYSPDMAYQFRTNMAPCHGYGPDLTDAHFDMATLNKLAAQEKLVSGYYYGDYYPLTPYSLDNNAWLAWQYDRPDLSSGFVQAFRRPDNGEPSRTFHLSGLDPNAMYRTHDFDTGLETRQTGRALMETGLTLTLTDKPRSALLIYRKVGNK